VSGTIAMLWFCTIGLIFVVGGNCDYTINQLKGEVDHLEVIVEGGKRFQPISFSSKSICRRNLTVHTQWRSQQGGFGTGLPCVVVQLANPRGNTIVYMYTITVIVLDYFYLRFKSCFCYMLNSKILIVSGMPIWVIFQHLVTIIM